MNRARRQGESFKDYRKSQNKQDLKEREKRKGKLVWNSASIVEREIPNPKGLDYPSLKIKERVLVQGTYVKK